MRVSEEGTHPQNISGLNGDNFGHDYKDHQNGLGKDDSLEMQQAALNETVFKDTDVQALPFFSTMDEHIRKIS